MCFLGLHHWRGGNEASPENELHGWKRPSENQCLKNIGSQIYLKSSICCRLLSMDMWVRMVRFRNDREKIPYFHHAKSTVSVIYLQFQFFSLQDEHSTLNWNLLRRFKEYFFLVQKVSTWLDKCRSAIAWAANHDIRRGNMICQSFLSQAKLIALTLFISKLHCLILKHRGRGETMMSIHQYFFYRPTNAFSVWFLKQEKRRLKMYPMFYQLKC